ncbi:MAG: helix-turn-helix transcriptional regulator [Clostridia bacterium]|nr:helix-turn-helix transcriptional regulator [Clostridia bacterium]
MSSPEKTYPNYLQRARKAHYLSQEDVAVLLKTTSQQISKWETGKQMMGVDKYIILAKHYNLSVDYLLGLVDQPKPLYEE